MAMRTCVAQPCLQRNRCGGRCSVLRGAQDQRYPVDAAVRAVQCEDSYRSAQAPRKD